ncbi:MAG: hypothetical protein ACRD1G_02280, partial [Acidimicrobiales bacterium]
MRSLTRDDPAKQQAAFDLFNHIRNGELTAEAPETVIADTVFVLAALDLYAVSASRFGDTLIVASMRRYGSTTPYLYDHGFDRYPDIHRGESYSSKRRHEDRRLL